MKVLIFEPDHTGHRYAYVGPILPALAGLGAGVTLVTTEAARGTPEFQEHIEPHARGLTVDFQPAIDVSSPMRAARGKLGLFDGAVARHQPEHLYSPSSDGLTQLLGARPLSRPPKGLETEGCMHRGSYAYPSGSLKRRLMVGAGLMACNRSPWTIVHHVDVVSYEWLKRRGGSFAQRSRLLADPVEHPAPIAHADARRRLGIPEDGRYVGCAGVLDTRKGIDLFVRTFAEHVRDPGVRLLLAGRLAPDIRALIHGPCADLVKSGRIVLIDRFVTKDELHLVLSAMDLVVTPYPAHVGLSNIALRAAAAGRPILASDFGWLGLIVPRFGLGSTCRVRDTDDFAHALARGLESAPSHATGPSAARLLEFHSHPNFIACWTARLRERMSLPASASYRTWEWVMQSVRGVSS